MDASKEADRIKKVSDDAQKSGFETWMNSETTRFMVSLIPAMDNKDALITLLRSAYASGFSCGSTAFAVDMLSCYMDRGKR